MTTGDHERVDRGECALVAATTRSGREHTMCHDLLADTDPDGTRVLAVSVLDSAARRRDLWEHHVGVDPPAAFAVVELSPGAWRDESDPGDPEWDVAVERVASPSDLTGIGMAVSSVLDTWEGCDEEITVCFHSVSALLQYAEAKRVFRFLHLLVSRVRSVDARAHFHFDPGMHDERVAATVTAPFDAVVRPDGEGERRYD